MTGGTPSVTSSLFAGVGCRCPLRRSSSGPTLGSDWTGTPCHGPEWGVPVRYLSRGSEVVGCIGGGPPGVVGRGDVPNVSGCSGHPPLGQPSRSGHLGGLLRVSVASTPVVSHRVVSRRLPGDPGSVRGQSANQEVEAGRTEVTVDGSEGDGERPGTACWDGGRLQIKWRRDRYGTPNPGVGISLQIDPGGPLDGSISVRPPRHPTPMDVHLGPRETSKEEGEGGRVRRWDPDGGTVGERRPGRDEGREVEEDPMDSCVPGSPGTRPPSLSVPPSPRSGRSLRVRLRDL